MCYVHVWCPWRTEQSTTSLDLEFMSYEGAGNESQAICKNSHHSSPLSLLLCHSLEESCYFSRDVSDIYTEY